MALTPEKIAELKAAYGAGLSLFEVDDQQIVTKPVDLKSYRAFKKTVLGGGGQMLAAEELLFAALVYPAPEVVRAYLDRRPLALKEIGDELVDASGLVDAAGEKITWTSQGVDASGNEAFASGDLTVTLMPVAGAVGRLYQQRIDNPTDRPMAGEWLLQQVIVTPTWEQLESRLHGRPFVLDRLVGLVAERAGRSVEVRAKKL